MDNNNLEHEICANCKKEIPQHNYVMHTAHCARNITLCKICNEPIPKNQFEDHKKSCIDRPKPRKLSFAEETSRISRNDRYQRPERLADSGISLKGTSLRQNSFERAQKSSSGAVSKSYDYSGREIKTNGPVSLPPPLPLPTTAPNLSNNKPATKSGLLACKYCDLELPKLDLEDHENYCGSRTDKCLECGELVMFKYKQLHMDSNHGFLKLKDEPGPKASWDSSTQRSSSSSNAYETTRSSSYSRRRPQPLDNFDYDPMPYLPSSYQVPGASVIKTEKGESYKEISRRLDCKTEYIRNLLHDSASITVPLRHNGAVPRNHFNHNKGPAPQPPRRRRNPPTELVIPCEFCGVPVPHEDLIQHETGCRPDLARFNPRRRSPEADDYFIAPQPSSPEVQLPCEFCADMIPASQLLRHQATCS